MRLRVSAPGHDLTPAEVDQVERDLEKIDRRLHEWDMVFAEVRINNGTGAPETHVTIELEYGRNHLIAKADNKDWPMAVREAREELLRQINDRSRRGHSSIAKGR